jgi:conjugal transfer mating pair stabilization protein TraG
MNFTLVTYGAGEVLQTTFNAIAAVLNSQTGTLYQPLVRLSLVVGLVWATAQMVYGDKAKFLHAWAMPAFLALSLFFGPTCRLHIQDPVSNVHFTVDHVPWGLGMVSGVISQIGDTLTREIEKTFSLPDDLKYHKTGAVMASNVIAGAKTFQVTNADLAETCKSFMTQCVVYDALLGRKYTLDDLRQSPDIWKLASTNPSPARCFTYKEPGRGKAPQIVTCQSGAALLGNLLKQDVQRAFSLFESKVLGSHTQRASGVAGAALKQYLPGAFDYMTRMAKSAEETMLQQMMIYSVVDAVETHSTALGNAPNFAVRRAYLSQRATQETLGGLAAHKLIAMKNVMEALIYAAFIFILPLALLPAGWSFIGRWISLVMWVQLWPPLYAILNFIMNVSLRSKGAALVASSGGITLGNAVGFINLHADMAAQAGFLTMAVGSLAYALVKGGASSFVHLASHLGGPATAAASQASESQMSGNYSFGNVSSGTVQAQNTTFGQQMWSPSYSGGSFAQNDGTVSRTTTAGDGHIVSISGSQLRSGLQLSESLSQSYTEQASKAKAQSESQMVAATEAQASHNRSLLELSQHQSQQTSRGESHSAGVTASTNQSFQKLDSLVNRFAEEKSLSKESATQILAAASAAVSASAGFNFLGNSLQGSWNTTLTGQLQGTRGNRKLFAAAQDYTKQESFQEAFSKASQAAHDIRTSELSDEGKRYVSSLNASSEKSNQYRREASANLQKSQSLSQMASFTKQNSGSINANLNQEYVEWLQTQELPHSKGPMGITEAEVVLSSRPELDHAYQQLFLSEKMAVAEDPRQGFPSSPEALRQTFERQAQNLHRLPPPNEASIQGQAQSLGFGENFKVDDGFAQNIGAHITSAEASASVFKEDLQKRGRVSQEKMTRKTR